MQGSGKSGGNGVAALREQMRSASASSATNLPPAPRPKKAKRDIVDAHDERAEKAERLAAAQHRTSLLSKTPKNSRRQAVEKKKGAPFLLQLLIVMMVAGGVAVSLDPTLLAQAKAYLEPHIFTVREMLNV